MFIVLMLVMATGFMLLFTYAGDKPLANQADPAVSRITTTDSAMMFNTSKVDVIFVAILVNNGDIPATVTVDIEVNETGSAIPLWSDSQSGVTVDTVMGAQVQFSKWSYTFSSETTFWVNVNISAASSNSDTTNDQKWEPLIIRDVHDIGPSGFENIIYGPFFHPSDNIDLAFYVKNFGTFNESGGIKVNCTIWNMSAMPWEVLYSENLTFFDVTPLAAQVEEIVNFPMWLTPSSYAFCRVTLTTFASWDQVQPNNSTFWDVEIDDRYDAAVASLIAMPAGPYAPNMTVDINCTIENIGNMDLSGVDVKCVISIDSIPIYTRYMNFSSIPAPENDAGMGNYIKNFNFMPNWTVPDVNGTAVINITLTCAQDMKVGNNYKEISYPIYAERRNLAVTAIAVNPDPVTAPQDVTFNVTIKNFEKPLSGFDLNTSVFDPGWNLIAYENVTVTQTIPGSGGVGYHEYVWPMSGDETDGDYHVISTLYLLGDITKNNNEREMPFTVDYLHDLSIANTTGIHDKDVINIPKAGKSFDVGINVLNKGPVEETYQVNATIYDSEYRVIDPPYSQMGLTISGGDNVNITFAHSFPVGIYNIVYEINFTGDEALVDNYLNISFELTNVTLPIASMTSPSPGQEVAWMGQVFLNGSASKALADGASIATYEWRGNWTADVLSTKAEAFVTVDKLGPVSVTLTVMDSLNHTASTTVNFVTVKTLVGAYQYYGLRMVYGYKSGYNITHTAQNITRPTEPSPIYESFDIYYDGGIGTTEENVIKWLNVSLDATYGTEGKLDLVDLSSLTVFYYDGSTWQLPSMLYGSAQGKKGWFNITKFVGKDLNYQMGLFGKKLTGTAMLSGFVSENNSEPIQNVSLEVYLGEDMVNGTSTDAEGAFEMVMELGIYDLHFSNDGYEDLDLDSVIVGASGRELTVFLIPVEKGTVLGKVTDVKTDVAIEGVSVELLKSQDEDVVKTTTTNVEGKYVIPNVDNGGYVLRFSKEGYETKRSPSFEISEAQMTFDWDEELTKLNDRPVLSNGGFSPNKGLETDTYSFWVTYSDADGDPPNANGVMVQVGSEKFKLEPEEGGGSDYQTGVKYTISKVKLDTGDYTVIFLTTDRKGNPAYSLKTEENLVVEEDTSGARMTMLLIAAAVILILLVVLVVGITILMFRRKAKKDQEDLEQITPEVDTKVSELMCTGCGSVLPEGTVKCPKCGRDLKKVEDQHAKEFKCPTCGAANKAGAKKCTACNKDFTAPVQDTTRMAEEGEVAEGIVAEGEAAEADAAWKEPIEDDATPSEEEGAEVKEEEPEEEDVDSEDLSDADFDDGLTFEGFDEL
jgi:hypothetical protein